MASLKSMIDLSAHFHMVDTIAVHYLTDLIYLSLNSWQLYIHLILIVLSLFLLGVNLLMEHYFFLD